MSFTTEHFERLKRNVRETYSLAEIPDWIVKHTRLKGLPYSFKDHEFQLRILSDVSRVVNVMKCSQVGLTEAMFRWALAVGMVIPDSSMIYTLPFSGDANIMAKTRVDPIIDSSPVLLENVNKSLNNSEVKQIGTSFLYFRGTNGSTQAISTPADAIISDEIDRSDPEILTQFHSRLTHSRWKLRRNFSTPTQPKWGIATEMETSRRFRNICKCNHCNHPFVPDFWEHVKIPGFDGDLRNLTKSTLARTQYLKGYLQCPKCEGVPDLSPQYREWVVENSLEMHEAAGYYVSPFDAPGLITVQDLLRSSVAYASKSEFENQNLGIPSEQASESMTEFDVRNSFVEGGIDLYSASHLHCMGVDAGLTMHISIGRMTPNGELLVVHRERVLLQDFKKRRAELAKQFRVVMTVVDTMPYVSLVMELQASVNNLFGGMYIESKALEPFKIKMFQGAPEEAKLPVHQAQINKNKAMDELMGMFKRDPDTAMSRIKVQRINVDIDELFVSHCTDMRRVQDFDNNQEMSYTWRKSKTQEDHSWHSLLYLLTACRLMPAAQKGAPAVAIPLMSRFKVRGALTQG